MPTVPSDPAPGIRELGAGRCVNGLDLRPPNVQVIWLPCDCAGGYGHRGWRCWTCGAVVYEPPHTGVDTQEVTFGAVCRRTQK